MPSSATLDASNFMPIVLSFHCKEYLRIRRLTEREGLKVERKDVVRDLLAVREFRGAKVDVRASKRSSKCNF